MLQIVQFDSPLGGPGVGILKEGRVYRSRSYQTFQDVLADWDQAEARLTSPEGPPLLEERVVADASLIVPLAPRTIFYAGANYRDHIEEMSRHGFPLALDPRADGGMPWHNVKAAGSTVVGPASIIERPEGSAMLDWELELAVVIGRTARKVSVDQALRCVAGYTVANDLSARDRITRSGFSDNSPFRWDWVGQKSFDGSCPLGPALTPARLVADVQRLEMKLWVNGILRQHSNTSQMIFTVAEQVAFLSRRFTLQPGDLILTGSPAGVGLASNTFLRAGDKVRQWIDCIGEFEFAIS